MTLSHPLSGGVFRWASGGRELELGVAAEHPAGASHRVPGAADEADVREPAGAAGAKHQGSACQVTPGTDWGRTHAGTFMMSRLSHHVCL